MTTSNQGYDYYFRMKEEVPTEMGKWNRTIRKLEKALRHEGYTTLPGGDITFDREYEGQPQGVIGVRIAADIPYSTLDRLAQQGFACDLGVAQEEHERHECDVKSQQR